MCMGESRVIGHNSNNEIERMKTSFNTDWVLLRGNFAIVQGQTPGKEFLPTYLLR